MRKQDENTYFITDHNYAMESKINKVVDGAMEIGKPIGFGKL